MFAGIRLIRTRAEEHERQRLGILLKHDKCHGQEDGHRIKSRGFFRKAGPIIAISSGMKVFILCGAILLGFAAGALAEPITATAAAVTGQAVAQQFGNAKFSAIHIGQHLGAGSTVTTGAASEVAIVLLPGSCAVLGENSQLKIEHLEFLREGHAIHRREARSRLESGKLFFGLENLNSKVTHFEVTTPRGLVSAHGTSGTVELRGDAVFLTVESGHVSFGQWTLAPGSLLVMTSTGTHLIDLLAKQIRVYDAKGILVEQRSLTDEELATGRASFASALSMMTQALRTGALGCPFASEVQATLAQLNQSLSSAGLQPILANFACVGAGSQSIERLGVNGHFPLPQLSGISGAGLANPANESGDVQSPEK